MLKNAIALLVAALAGLAIALPPAKAGDLAHLNILGFTADASIFAFEEHGVQDGSGFPYANRFYIDVAKDEFVAGTPIRVMIEDESVPPQQAREQARVAGEAIVADAELAANRGNLVGINAITELSADPFRMTVSPVTFIPSSHDPIEFRLDEYDVEPVGFCADLGPTKGFRLLRIDLRAGAEIKLLHEDKTVPQSRRCPTGYRLGAVQTFFPSAGPASFAVLVAVRSFGFEGPDYRWIAVTGRL